MPYPDGYRAVLPLHRARAREGRGGGGRRHRPHPLGLHRHRRRGPTPAQIAALRGDGYRGALSVETHWRKPGDSGPESTRETLAGLRRFLPSADV